MDNQFLWCFWVWHSGKARCVPWQSILWLLLLRSCPFVVWFAVFLDETQIWLEGFAGGLGCVSLVWFDLPVFIDLLCPCTNVVLTDYAHIRTEPQCDIGQTQEKKKGKLSMQERRCLLKALSVLAKRSLQQSHFRSRKHIGFLDPTSGPSQQYQAFPAPTNSSSVESS